MTSKILEPRILLITKDRKLLHIFENCLTPHPLKIKLIKSLDKGIKFALTNKYSLLLISTDLSVQSNFELLKKFRDKNKFYPILIVGPNKKEAQIKACELNVTKYHIQPIHYELLKAQIHQLISTFEEKIYFESSNIVIDIEARSMSTNNETVLFTHNEFTLLIFLIKAEGHILSKETINSHIYNYTKEMSSIAVETLVSRVRTKIKVCTEDPFIETIYQSGYRIFPKYFKHYHFTKSTF